MRGRVFSGVGWVSVGEHTPTDRGASRGGRGDLRWMVRCSRARPGCRRRSTRGPATLSRRQRLVEPAAQLVDEARVDRVRHPRLAVDDRQPSRGQPRPPVARELDRDHGVQRAVPDRDRNAEVLGEVELEALDGRDEAAQRDQRGRRRAAAAEPERVAHHGALREAAEHGARRGHPRGLCKRVEPRRHQRQRLEEGLRIGVADPRDHVPVRAARRQAQRPPRRHGDQSPLRVEHVGQRLQVVLVRRAPMQQHERSFRCPGGGADAVGDVAGVHPGCRIAGVRPLTSRDPASHPPNARASRGLDRLVSER